MNIQQAKTELEHTLRVYLQKDEAGRYLFPGVRQRPILLMGPPGVGKTAIMEQVARENHVALVAYTMTHHTRQSAVGLPKIEERGFGEERFFVTRYTMSEIIAEVYAAMERTGLREGILFLDEINCVSETLAPTMLQFLQNKTFGNHRLPEGWLIVAAGNPPEYNKSVRDFDIVTLDRVRRMDITADVEVFLSYGRERGLHGGILSYLALRPERFYHVSRRESELCYVTARGWEDLSQMLLGCEALDIPVTEELVGEFLHLPETVRDFFAYYSLYEKYGTDYGIPDILSGEAEPGLYGEKCAMARAGDFTERFAVVNLVLDRLRTLCRRYGREDSRTVELHQALKSWFDRQEPLEDFLAARRTALETKKRFGLLGFEELRRQEQVEDRLDGMCLTVKQRHLFQREQVQEGLRQLFREELDRRSALIADIGNQLERGFRFVEDCFGDGQELTLLVSGLTASPAVMEFIARHGCECYTRTAGRLLCRLNEPELQQACRDFLNTAISKADG